MARALRLKGSGTTAGGVSTGGIIRATFKATVTVISGTGKYQNATGGGTFTGARVRSMVIDIEFYNDFVVNIKN
jgi:hypothetical protein